MLWHMLVYVTIWLDSSNLATMTCKKSKSPTRRKIMVWDSTRAMGNLNITELKTQLTHFLILYKIATIQPNLWRFVCNLLFTVRIDHPNGSGETKEIAMQTFISLRCNTVWLVLIIADKTSLEDTLRNKVRKILECNGYKSKCFHKLPRVYRSYQWHDTPWPNRW